MKPRSDQSQRLIEQTGGSWHRNIVYLGLRILFFFFIADLPPFGISNLGLIRSTIRRSNPEVRRELTNVVYSFTSLHQEARKRIIRCHQRPDGYAQNRPLGTPNFVIQTSLTKTKRLFPSESAPAFEPFDLCPEIPSKAGTLLLFSMILDPEYLEDYRQIFIGAPKCF